MAGRIREAHLLYDIRNVLGVDRRTRWMVCPLPGHPHGPNPTPSFSIYDGEDGVQRFRCHGNCGKSGDVIDLVGFLNIPGYDPANPENVSRALSCLDRKFEIAPPPKPEKPRPIEPDKWKAYLPPGEEVIEYARSRGLTPVTLEKFRVGQYKHFMAMPTFHEGRLRMIKFRSTWPAEMLNKSGDLEHQRYWSAKGSQKGLFNYDAVAWTDEPVLILKAEIPVMLADQLGFLACAPNGGESSIIQEVIPVLSFSAKKVVVGDNDEAGRANAIQRAELLRGVAVFPPPRWKDWDEWFLAEPENCIEETRRWLK